MSSLIANPGAPTRDLLAPVPEPRAPDSASLLLRQADLLDEIVSALRRLTPDVLATSVVMGTSQLTNAITDGNSHEIRFEVGGMPVRVHRLLVFSSLTASASVSVRPLSKLNDGMALTAGSVLDLQITTSSLHVIVPTATAATPASVNGASDSMTGGLFVYGYTTHGSR